MTCASIAPVVKDVHYRGNVNGLLVILGGPALLVPLESHRKSFRWWVNHASAHNKNNRIASKAPCPQCVVVSQMLPISMAHELAESLVGRLPITDREHITQSDRISGGGARRCRGAGWLIGTPPSSALGRAGEDHEVWSRSKGPAAGGWPRISYRSTNISCPIIGLHPQRNKSHLRPCITFVSCPLAKSLDAHATHP